MSLRRALLISAAFSGLLSSPALADPIAGTRPTQIPGTMRCEGPPTVFVNGFGSTRIATGGRSNGVWSITGFDQDGSEGSAYCSIPTAAEANVECRVSGQVVDRTRCPVSEYSKLYQQGLTPVGGGGSDLRTATWVMPGMVTNGCVGTWEVEQGAVPPSCGEIKVQDTVTCVATNPQSGNVPAQYVFCSPSSKPPTERTVRDERSCNVMLSPGLPGPTVDQCGETTRSRIFSCSDQNSDAYKLTDPRCAPQVNEVCATQTCGQRTEYELTVIEAVSLEACSPGERGDNFWVTGEWESSGETCGVDTQTRTVNCYNNFSDTFVADSYCSQSASKPISARNVNVSSGCAPTPTPPPAESCSASVYSTLDGVSVDEASRECVTSMGYQYSNATDGVAVSHVVKGSNGAEGSYTFCVNNMYVQRGICQSSMPGISYIVWQSERECQAQQACTAPTPTPTPAPEPAPRPCEQGIYIWNGQNWDDYDSPDWLPPGGISQPLPADTYPKEVQARSNTRGYVTGVIARDARYMSCGTPAPTPTPPPAELCLSEERWITDEGVAADCVNTASAMGYCPGAPRQKPSDKYTTPELGRTCASRLEGVNPPKSQCTVYGKTFTSCSTPPPSDQSCIDECGETKMNGMTWTTRGGNLPRRTDGFEKSRCEAGQVVTFSASNTVQPAASCN